MAEENSTAETEKKPSKNKLIIIIAIVVLLIGLIAGGVTFWLLGGDSAETTEEVAEPVVLGDLAYHALNPPFVMTYMTTTGQRYLQVGLIAASRNAKVLEAIQFHDPVVRNEVLTIIGEQKFNDMRTDAGRQKLLEELTERIEAILRNEAQVEGLDALLFSNFVMQ